MLQFLADLNVNFNARPIKPAYIINLLGFLINYRLFRMPLTSEASLKSCGVYWTLYPLKSSLIRS
jgi:hypothetical protein